MEINIGDKVRFLNQVGGGIVSGFQKGGVVLVEDEDGFEMPVLQSEVVVIESKVQQQAAAAAQALQAEQEKERARANERLKDLKEKEHEPTEEELRIAELKEMYAREQKQKSSVTSHAPHNIQLFQKPQLLQQPQKPQFSHREATISANATVNATSGETLEERIARLELTVRRLTTRLERLEDARALREKKKAEESHQRETVRKSKDGILEVDLHAHELLETTAGMGPKDIKDYQLQVVRDTLKRFASDRGRKIVFIHGNGEGVLRKAVIDIIRREYPRMTFQDASFQQYGFGATMVTV